MQSVLNAALPIFGLILIGYLCARFEILGRAATDSLNRFAVFLALPALLFQAMTRITLEQLGQAGFALAFAGGVAATFATAFMLGRRSGRRIADASILGLDASYANVGFMGIPLCLLVFGEAGIPPAIIATLFTACLLFAFAIVMIELDLQRAGSLWRTVRKVLVSLVRNPLLVAPAAGLAVGMTGLALPAPVERFATLLGSAASPCALVCIGLFLAQERGVTGNATMLGLLVGMKLVLQPAVTALLAFQLFSMPPDWARAAVLLSALPIGSGPFTLAHLYRLEVGVTSGAILASHLGSVVTVTLLLAWLG